MTLETALSLIWYGWLFLIVVITLAELFVPRED